MSALSKLDSVLELLTNRPVEVAHWCGLTKLTELHNTWLVKMIMGIEDMTLQAHRNSYKTTCLSLAVAIIMILWPQENIILLRKTDNDVKEIISQVGKILLNRAMIYLSKELRGEPVSITQSVTDITTNYYKTTKGAKQLLGLGLGSSITGKHANVIITDDIINISDRISRAERENTKLLYQELQNIKNPGGRINNTGTPWHKEDAFTLMPTPQKYDCYTTGLLTQGQIQDLRRMMAPSLFAANYELKHIASEDALFRGEITWTDNDSLLYNGIAHIDASYGGGDGTAMTLAKKQPDGKCVILGKVRREHVDRSLNNLLATKNLYKCGSVHLETNADKGYLAGHIRQLGEYTNEYAEKTNKFIKIASFARANWDKLVFHKNTDPEYVSEIYDYTEDAEHDDCADSLASVLRVLYDPTLPTWDFSFGGTHGDKLAVEKTNE